MLKVDFHVHSELSKDGRENLAQIAAAAKNAGIDAVCVCDHNVYAFDAPKEIEGITLLPGCEISSSHEHILALFCNTPVDVKRLSENGLPDAKTVIDEIHRCGGLAAIAHPFGHTLKASWNGLDLKPDAVEQYNARAWMKYADANKLAAGYAKEIGVPCLGGSDAHLAQEIGNAFTIVNCENISCIKDAVMAGKTEAVLMHNTKRIYKGLSQLTRGRKLGGLKSRLLALGVFIKCLCLDILGK